jgi:hypothetical protein
MLARQPRSAPTVVGCGGLHPNKKLAVVEEPMHDLSHSPGRASTSGGHGRLVHLLCLVEFLYMRVWGVATTCEWA